MKKLLLIICVFILMIFIETGCEKKPDPKAIFEEYSVAWQNSDFSSMYSYLSEENKKGITENDFVQRYKNIYQGIEAKNLTIEPSYPDPLKPDQSGSIIVPFKVALDTVAGEIRFSSSTTLKKELLGDQEVWRITWSSRMIFPDLEEGDKVRVDKKLGSRGEITDRLGNPLAVNGIVAEVGIVPGKLSQDADASKKQIAEILGLTVELINKKLSASYVKPDMFIPIKSISKDDREKIDKLLKIPGVMINDKKARVYPLKDKAAHLTGYIQAINAEELDKLAKDGYVKDDYIGKSGLEKIYEKVLKPENGSEIYIVDKAGKKKKTLALIEAKNGKNIKLTIDSNIQSTLYDELKGDAATGVVMHPKTGEVMALVSSPSYDPNSFILGMPDAEWKALNENPQKPLLNRFQKTFCPGSTFKPITAAIALNANKLDPNAVKSITGLKWQKDKSWGSYSVTRVKEYPEPASLLNALVYSDNIYFAQTALELGSDAFLNGVRNLGIGEKIPFEYGLYNSQFSSDGTVKNEIQLADSGYGQGEILMNPVQLAAIYSSFVNEGSIISPYLELKKDEPPVIWKENVFSPETANFILKCLTEAVERPTGTGHQTFIKEIPIAGKTGTAEIKLNQQDKNGIELGWFAGVNTDNPRLLVLAMVEDVKNRGGSHYVVPKVKKIFEQFVK